MPSDKEKSPKLPKWTRPHLECNVTCLKGCFCPCLIISEISEILGKDNPSTIASLAFVFATLNFFTGFMGTAFGSIFIMMWKMQLEGIFIDELRKIQSEEYLTDCLWLCIFPGPWFNAVLTSVKKGTQLKEEKDARLKELEAQATAAKAKEEEDANAAQVVPVAPVGIVGAPTIATYGYQQVQQPPTVTLYQQPQPQPTVIYQQPQVQPQVQYIQQQQPTVSYVQPAAQPVSYVVQQQQPQSQVYYIQQ